MISGLGEIHLNVFINNTKIHAGSPIEVPPGTRLWLSCIDKVENQKELDWYRGSNETKKNLCPSMGQRLICITFVNNNLWQGPSLIFSSTEQDDTDVYTCYDKSSEESVRVKLMVYP